MTLSQDANTLDWAAFTLTPPSWVLIAIPSLPFLIIDTKRQKPADTVASAESNTAAIAHYPASNQITERAA